MGPQTVICNHASVNPQGYCRTCGVSVFNASEMITLADYLESHSAKAPALSPLAELSDALGNDIAALDLHVDSIASTLRGDEVAEFCTIVALLKNCHDALREAVKAREGQ